MRSFTAIRMDAGPFCGCFVRKGEVVAYAGRFEIQKDLSNVPPSHHSSQDAVAFVS